MNVGLGLVIVHLFGFSILLLYCLFLLC